ncbi:hypothetical protein [Dactylosporangium sp. NPDC050588]|uniref:hypothetical protein n=1 Tax=Dactylosporangium sp. NPDC050588 TaxID=3157211 RepID=UPI0033E313EF
MHRGRWIAGVLVTLLAGGCGAQDEAVPPAESGDQLRRQAREALDRHDQAVERAGGQGIVVVGARTGQVGEWEDDKARFKVSLLVGKVAAVAALPAAPPADGVVVWDGGASRTVAIIAAGAALAELVEDGAGDCADCPVIEVTGARLGTARIQTAQGAATAPAWEFALRGSAVLVTRTAFAGVMVVPPPWNASHPPGGLSIQTVRVDGTTLTAEFVGAVDPASAGPCGVDYTAEAVESPNAVVVIVHEHPASTNARCTALGATRTVTVQLAAELDGRAVLEVRQGLPVPVTGG